ncbi:uncharacterized protein FA14DRAFT_96448 [Meira miltonrushii]|uniref:Uncharacterized protein n=1 Tax=Meira miltonrushii TaxID=1280837 RepID=A0A316V2Y5_9BASI|nr:uncharacterized protein FA14DRAFT_96448 [Meira miltonrushii]PWN31358.1 hypothetical protein FA14DRAFT_96448 [Meira miltonrushii]
MPRSNPSHVSYSSAASVSFRVHSLQQASITFQSYDDECPGEILALRTNLSRWPSALRVCTHFDEIEQVAISTAGGDSTQICSAVARARQITDRSLDRCSLQHERVWMRSVNERVLHDLIHAVSSDELSSTEDYLWTEGRHLMGPNAESLHDPKPDFAFGLAAVIEHKTGYNNTDCLDWDLMNLMKLSSSYRITFSPSQMQDIIYPAFVYEAKSDKNPIVWAENQVAVGAARALGLLDELAELSGKPYIPCIVAATSAGAQWQFHLAYRTGDSRIKFLLPMLDKPLWIRNHMERVMLLTVITRIKRWIMENFQHDVKERLTALRSDL